MDSPQANGGTAEFPTNNSAMTAATYIPQANQVATPPSINVNNGGGGQSSTSSSIASAVGGGIGGLISKGIGALFSFLADGGQPQQPQQVDPKSASIGYLVGTLHQGKFKGDPKLLAQAVAEAKNMLAAHANPQHLASGGAAGAEGQASNIQSAILQAMGMGDPTQKQNNTTQLSLQNPTSLATQPSQGSPMGSPINPALPQNMLNLQEGANSGDFIDKAILGRNAPTSSQQKISAKKGGYMDSFTEGPQAMESMGYAQGGPPQQPNQGPPPLKPGQTFQGDGSVKGPGTSTSDSIPAKLSDGEFVFSAPAVKFYGVDKLNKMNEQGKQGFMQALGQVQANQQQNSPQGAPPQQSSAMPAPAAPQQQQAAQQQAEPDQDDMGGMAKGGISHKRSGYMGL